MKKYQERINVAIVGGGPGCKAVMKMVMADVFTELQMLVMGVASRNPSAPFKHPSAAPVISN